MGWSYGRLHQELQIKIDVSKLAEHIADEVLAAIDDNPAIDSVDFDECYFDDDDLVINASYDASFRAWSCRETRYEPAEYEEERPYIADGKHDWLIEKISENIRKLINVKEITEDSEKVRYEDD